MGDKIQEDKTVMIIDIVLHNQGIVSIRIEIMGHHQLVLLVLIKNTIKMFHHKMFNKNTFSIIIPLLIL